jgi:hypothetical protein
LSTWHVNDREESSMIARSVLVCGALAALIVATDASAARAADGELGELAQRVARGFKIAPVPLNLAGLDRGLVGLGSYIVNAQGGCNDCHTEPPYAAGGDPFLGQRKKINAAAYLAGGMEFGPFISRNITPDANGRPGGLTLIQFIAVMRTGHDPDDPSRLLQVMPWPVYQDMRYDDLRAIYTYLKAIPSLPSARAALEAAG